jgi:hypothetical protein
VIEVKVVKKKFKKKKKKVIDESMYIDDGRYHGPDEVRNAAFKLHRMYLQNHGLDISAKANDEQVT